MSTKETRPPLDRRQQDHYLALAKQAAEAGNPKEMLEAFLASGLLDGLSNRLEFAWKAHIHEMDRAQIVANAIDEFYAVVNRGESVRDVGAWIRKVAGNMATEFYDSRRLEEPLDPTGHPVEVDNDHRIVTQEERLARRRRCLEVARSLLPLLSVSENIRRVMAYIFDAVEQGVEDIQPIEVARALGVKETSIRTWIARGFERLTARAKEAGYTHQEYELIQIDFDEEQIEADDSA